MRYPSITDVDPFSALSDTFLLRTPAPVSQHTAGGWNISQTPKSWIPARKPTAMRYVYLRMRTSFQAPSL